VLVRSCTHDDVDAVHSRNCSPRSPPIVSWHDEGELVAQVNDAEYGLAAYVYAGDLGRALRLGERIEAGMIGINRGLVSDPSAPFGGVKQSGLGREGARDGLRAFQQAQYLSVNWVVAADHFMLSTMALDTNTADPPVKADNGR
jgi:delta 1-pyrroline-5-carboxylate dehydrogenase